MHAVIIDAPGNMRIGRLPDPTPKPDELVIRVGACGICGTDLHVVDGDSPLVRYPIVPGHEFAGEVVAVGSDVQQSTGFKDMKLTVGARVAIEPNMYCGHCAFCRRGRSRPPHSVPPSLKRIFTNCWRPSHWALIALSMSLVWHGP